MKKIMIPGAGIYQLPLIKKAKELGLIAIVASVPGNYPGFSYADKVYYIDTKDAESILKTAASENIDGIVTTGTDAAVVSIGTVCDKMGLLGISKEAAEISCNKLLMKKAFLKNGIPSARFVVVRTYDDLYGLSDKLPFPMVFKAVDSSGSRGIVKVENACDMKSAYKKVFDITKKDYFIAEEFLSGEEFGAQAFVYKKEIKFIMPHGDFVFYGDAGVPVGHYAPYEIPDDIKKQVEDIIPAAVRAIGLDNCALNFDFMLYNGRVYVLELGARAGATCLAELVSLYYNMDYYKEIIKTAVGDIPDFSAVGQNSALPCAGVIIKSDKDGVIKSIENKNPENKNIVETVFDYKAGDRVRRFGTGPDRIGHIIVRAATLDGCMELIKKTKENINIEIC